MPAGNIPKLNKSIFYSNGATVKICVFTNSAYQKKWQPFIHGVPSIGGFTYSILDFGVQISLLKEAPELSFDGKLRQEFNFAENTQDKQIVKRYLTDNTIIRHDFCRSSAS